MDNHIDAEKIQDGMPEVAQAKRKNPKVLIAIGILLVGGLAIHFLNRVESKSHVDSQSIDDNFTVPNTTRLQQSGITAIPAPAATQQPQQAAGLTDEQAQILIKKKQELQRRLSAPMMVVHNNGQQVSHHSASSKGLGEDPNTQFMNQVTAQAPNTVTATQLHHMPFLIAEGHLIHAVLETAINSDLPGYLRAVVSTPVYSEDGSRVLIPSGSRLIGQYKSGMLSGQARVFAVWTRVITPKGISINIASPGVDRLGMAGTGADAINRHFWQVFGNSILLSIISAGVSNVGVSGGDEYNASQAYRVAIANSLSRSANKSLSDNISIKPTLVVNQGKQIMVFVAHDLDFSHALRQADAASDINVFK